MHSRGPPFAVSGTEGKPAGEALHRPSLRGKRAFRVVLACLEAARERAGTRIVHFSVQSNHIHLIVEAHDEHRLARGMQSLAIRIAKNVNQVLSRRGAVFEDHYFAEQMRSPAQVRHTLRYVLRNAEHHSGRRGVDGRASEIYLDVEELPSRAPVTRPRCWLLAIGWRRARGRPWPGQPAAGFD